MRACAIEMDMRNSKSNFYASRPTQHAAPTRANPDLNPLNSYRKNPLVRSTIWGKTKNERDPGEERLDRRHRSELFCFLRALFGLNLLFFGFFLVCLLLSEAILHLLLFTYHYPHKNLRFYKLHHPPWLPLLYSK